MNLLIWRRYPMKKNFIVLFFISCVSCVVFAEPVNFNVEQQQLLNYYYSGKYMHDLNVVIQKAKVQLAKSIKKNTQHKKLAIVLDIDETSLSNFKQLEALYGLVNWVGGIVPKKPLVIINNTFHDSVIRPTLELYRYAVHHDVSVFFVTGRDNRQVMEKKTIENLKKAGYTKFVKVFFNNPTAEPSGYKINTRKNIISQGYDIVLNIGDQVSDLAGGYADHDYKLPNPFYFIP